MSFAALLLATALHNFTPSAWITYCPRQPFGPEGGLVQEEWSTNDQPTAHVTTWFAEHGARLCTVVRSVKHPGKRLVHLISGRAELRLEQNGKVYRHRLKTPFASGGRVCPERHKGQPPTEVKPIAAMTLLGREAAGTESAHAHPIRDWRWQQIPLRQEVLNPKARKLTQATGLLLGDQPEPAACLEAEKLLAAP